MMHTQRVTTENNTPQYSPAESGPDVPRDYRTAQASDSPQFSSAGSSVQSQPQSHQVTVVRQAAEPKGMSIASMIIGLVSIFLGFTFILPIIGFILGIMGLKREPAGRGMAITGVILCGLILAVWVILLLAGLIFGVGLFSAASS